MKLKQFITQILLDINETNIHFVDFDIGLEPDMEINPDSANRIKFTVMRK